MSKGVGLSVQGASSGGWGVHVKGGGGDCLIPKILSYRVEKSSVNVFDQFPNGWKDQFS